jgi:hypothetical protein
VQKSWQIGETKIELASMVARCFNSGKFPKGSKDASRRLNRGLTMSWLGITAYGLAKVVREHLGV